MASTVVLSLAALAFCTWAVYLGGLAALQEDCMPAGEAFTRGIGLGTAGLGYVYGFSGMLSCMRLYRFYWFIMSFEFVLILGLGLAVATGNFAKARVSFLGLFAVAALLYIETTNAFLSAFSLEYYSKGGAPEHRMRTTIAGALMTAVVNMLIVFALGYETSDAAPAGPATASKEVEGATAV